LLTKAEIPYEFAEAREESTLAEAMSLVLLGDYASFYLAMLNEVDLASTDAMNFVKQYLAQSSISSDQGRAKAHSQSRRCVGQSAC
jgi:glucose/mannose-6-phosphate isomerase